jgi:hypothetical protein
MTKKVSSFRSTPGKSSPCLGISDGSWMLVLLKCPYEDVLVTIHLVGLMGRMIGPRLKAKFF